MKKKSKNSLIVSPTPAFFDWLARVSADPTKGKPAPPADYSSDYTITYTLPDLPTEEAFTGWMKVNYRVIFKNELLTWKIDDKFWPPPTLENFYKLFSVAYKAEMDDNASI